MRRIGSAQILKLNSIFAPDVKSSLILAVSIALTTVLWKRARAHRDFAMPNERSPERRTWLRDHCAVEESMSVSTVHDDYCLKA